MVMLFKYADCRPSHDPNRGSIRHPLNSGSSMPDILAPKGYKTLNSTP